ncbi:hypothetical protein B0A49_13521 [Cryomyces minteri]|uniref:Uncharacterized protein n=1 Tax=Cryomyces minteri TaxID=331657 RepID=A0A4U0VYR5_9PEZI|nr:hypothetical protein B0A49_13521 [Cryomyces minteri]
MSPSPSTTLKEPPPAAEPTSSSPTDSGVEPHLPPSPPLSTSQVSITSERPPNSVSKLLQIFRDLKDGTWTEQASWDKHRLLREERTELWQRLNLDKDEDLRAWVKHKLRYDYDDDTEHLIIRMPTRLHDKFIVRVVARLRAQLATLTSANPDIRETVSRVSEGMQWTVPLGSMADSRPEREGGEIFNATPRSPDYVFEYAAARWPPLVLEISYSQKRADLDDLAYSYIRGSSGNIKTVVGLDIEYTPPGKSQKTKKATLDVWRYGLVRDSDGEEVADCVREVENEPFRSDNGNPLQGSLSLTLADFIPPRILPYVLTSATRALPISISFSDLTSDLAKSEEEMVSLRTRSGLSLSPPQKWADRKRAASEEELDCGRERKYQAVEEAEERKASHEDSDFEPLGHAAQEQEPVEADRRIAIPRRSTRRSRALEED